MTWPEQFNSSAAHPGWSVMAIFIGYALGCFSTGYYFVRWRTGRDVRVAGSGSTGATNVGRALGKTGFVLTLLLDALKGALAVALARKLDLPLWAAWLTAIAVVGGHIWPAQLRFRGGKGMATLVGALLILEPRLLLAGVFIFPVALIVIRRFTLSGLAALALTPFLLPFLNCPPPHVVGFSFLTAIILWAHRQNLHAGWTAWSRAGGTRHHSSTP